MTEMKVAYSGTRLADYARQIAQLGAQGELEMARGLNDAGKIVITQVRRALQGQMGVLKYATIVAATNAIPAVPGRLNAMQFDITASRKGLPIKNFAVSVSHGSSVTASPWGTARTFERSFMTSVRGLLLARRESSRLPIRGLRGPSPSKELVRDQSLKTFEAAVTGVVEPVIVRRLARLMP